MEKEFILYEQALALKELGFDEPCFAYYNSDVNNRFDTNKPINAINWNENDDFDLDTSAPTFSQSFRWFREKYGLIGWIEGKQMYGYRIESTIPTDDQLSAYPFRKYEEAELECLKKLIEIFKNK